MNRLYPEYEHHGIYDKYQAEEKRYCRIAWIRDIVACHFEYMDKTGSYKCQYKELRILFLPDSVHVMIPLYTQYSLFSLIMPEIGEIFNNLSDQHQKNSGFTLVELIVVPVILAILVAMTIK